MEKAYIHSLIILIGGAQLPGEKINHYLRRVSRDTGIGYRSLSAAYYGQEIGPGIFISGETRQKLEKAAKRARRPRELIAYTEHHLVLWERDPERYGAFIDAARDFLGKLRRHDLPGRTANGPSAKAAGMAPKTAG